MKATLTANEAIVAVTTVMRDVAEDIRQIGHDLEDVHKVLNKAKIADAEKKRATAQKDALELAAKSAALIATRLREMHRQLSVIPAMCVVELSPLEMTLLSYVGHE